METLTWFDGPDYPFGERISYYSTTHTSDAAYIIGGFKTKNVVAEFINGQWRRLKDLNKGRDSHGSINIGTKTIIIGGEAISGLYAETEVWEFETGDNNIIGATLQNNNYAYGIGLYAVNFDFCRK